MMWIKKEWNKFSQLKISGKVQQVVWIVFLAALIIPTTRRSIVSNLHRLTAKAPKLEATDFLSDEEWNWKIINEQEEVLLLSDLKGKPIFLNFWATWCPSCMAEFPDIEEMYEKYGDNMAFVLLTREGSEVLKKFKCETGYDFPIYRYKSQVPPLFEHQVIPMTYIIDSKGQLRSKEKGTADWSAESVHTYFDALISYKE